MVRRGSFIGGQDNLSVPDAPTIGAATAGNTQVSVAFTAPSAVGDDPITNFGVSVFPATGTTKTFRVTVASGNLYGGGTGNVFYIDGVSNPALTLVKGFTYVFDQEDSSNSGHPFHFKDTGGSQYSTGVTVTGTAGQAGAKVTLVLAEDATEPSQYYCTSHGNGMGNLITLVAPSASDDPLGQAQYSNTGSSSPITVTGLSNGTSYVAKVWAINDYGNGPLSDATSSFSPVNPVGLIFGGSDQGGSPRRNDVAKITITSTGNATDFGDLSATREAMAGLASSTRAISVAGAESDHINTIDYFTFSSAGNATDFGDTTSTFAYLCGLSNSTRGVYGAGYYNGSRANVIEYITIASTGNGTDFGDLTVSRSEAAGFSSSTRGVFAGGHDGSGRRDTIDYITIASTGNATDFGDLQIAGGSGRQGPGGSSNSTRGLIAGGYQASNAALTNAIEYVTIASTGHGTDFGDLLNAIAYIGGGISSSSRAVFHCGQGSGIAYNVIQYVTITSTGDATDFGDHTQTVRHTAGASNSHGGL